ncbi:hypothetical protein CHS0354_035645 [Potamilus streckersoni]|uniref:C1q domain-containing protein n=1 Tax=Potamilus streckersoni TaxID=2493646 RepID=A0AAE0TAC0_9BIVA|nr:hypothetical protein CHS0354_035645 [Potamilus streckersoni]
MIVVKFTRLMVALGALIVTVKTQDYSDDSFNDVMPKLLDRMEKMEIKMNEIEIKMNDMEIRERSMKHQIRILQNNLHKQREENERLKVLTLAMEEKKNRDDFRIPKQGKDGETDTEIVNKGNQTSEAQSRIRQAPNEPVAFSTYISKYVDHLGINQVIKYDGVLTNEGNAYNVHSGMFTCPQDGLYLISFFVATISNQAVFVQLMVDDINDSGAVAYSMHPGQNDQGGNVALLRLRRGQSVWIQTHFRSESSLASTTEFRYATFSGVLLSD